MSRPILLAAALILAAIAPAQQPATIQGIVHDDVGGLIPGAGVRLILRNQLVGETQTDSVGTFRLDAPAAVGYSLHVVKPGLCLGSVDNENLAHDPINVILKTPERPVPGLIQVSSVIQHAGCYALSNPTTLPMQRRTELAEPSRLASSSTNTAPRPTSRLPATPPHFLSKQP